MKYVYESIVNDYTNISIIIFIFSHDVCLISKPNVRN